MYTDSELRVELNNAILWIKNYVKNSNCKGVVLGLSGGKDSAVVLAMAVKALGKENVIAVSMPCHSINKDFDDAKNVAERFGVKLYTIDLTKAYDEFENSANLLMNEILQLNKNVENSIEDDTTKNSILGEISLEAKVNIKPRMRMTTLYSIAQSLGYLVIGTGNLCESIVGYTTKWGDNASDFNPIANFTVSEVLRIGDFLGVPKEILIKAPSDGLGAQTDEEKMGIKYAQIEEMIETGETEELAKKEILRRFYNSRHKKNLIPSYKFIRKNYFFDLEQKNNCI